ncbi:unnamed protein product [Notodromas monacha]|uniref:WH2 domain-containing protein n=1 Tax=Notodromas monacha TaxID=399045 RepID=A0A7R9GDZ2_9CRUS|nr:unnamed protein product [Notodromas monacha]CAG0917361.1 unnamed protein product [Notodromas monacha]
MKDLESKATKDKLRKVVTNDRSQPLLPRMKSKGQFVYDSEKPNLHHQLLNEIQRGVNLKRVKHISDRSRPLLEGLKKFRRQLTIEEQQKVEETPPEPIDEDLDDIDKLRDDLQATKQLLEIELRNKHVEKELNEKLQSKLEQMETELKTLKTSLKETQKQNQELSEQLATRKDSVDLKPLKRLPLEPSFSFADLKKDLSKANLTRNDSVIFNEIDAFEEEYNNLQSRLAQAQKESQTWRSKFEKASKELQEANAKLNPSQDQKPVPKFVPSPESSSEEEESSTEEEEDEEEEEEEEEEESESEADEDKKELRSLESKLRSTQERAKAARSEKKSLRKSIKDLEKSIKSEKENYSRLKQDVDKMARLMSTDDCTSEDTLDSSESSSSDSESSSDADTELELDPTLGSRLQLDNLNVETRYAKINSCIKKLQEDLNRTKRCNHLLKSNADKLQQDYESEKAKYKQLEQELNHVLAELG